MAPDAEGHVIPATVESGSVVVTSAASLSAGDTVSLRGPLFKSLTGPPVMAAVKVVKR